MHVVFADSEVAAVTAEGRLLRIRFAAAEVSHPHAPGGGAPASHLAGLELVCQGGPWPAPEAGCLGRLTGGLVRVGGQALPRLPLPWPLAPGGWPLDTPGPFRLELGFANGTVLVIEAELLWLVVPPGARLHDSLAC